MYLLAPGQVYVETSSTGGMFYPYEKKSLSTGLAVPGCPTIEIQDQKGYLWDSDRIYGQDNDCVHRKLVGADNAHPFLMAGGELLYPKLRFYGNPEHTGHPTVQETNWNKGWTVQCGTSSPNRTQFSMRWTLSANVITGYANTAKTTAFKKRAAIEIRVIVYADHRLPNVSYYSGSKPLFLDELLESVRNSAILIEYDYSKRWEKCFTEGLCDTILTFGRRFADWVESYITRTTVVSLQLTHDPFSNGLKQPDFLLNEDALIRDRYPAALFNANNFKGYWRTELLQKAYFDCLQSVPRMNENNISNIVEGVKFLKSLIVNKRIEFPESLSDGWLAYRYTYSTGKSDIDAAISYAERHLRVGSKPFSCYGLSSINYEGTDIICRCKVDVRNKELSYLDEIWKNLDLWGLSPRFYVLWDMLPYSFIADWFLPIGDVLSVVDARSIYSEERYDFSNICYSLSYSRLIDGLPWKFYTRWRASAPPQLNGIYWFEPTKVSAKTVSYRTADATALILGRKG